MERTNILMICSIVFILSRQGQADEGMYTFDNPPMKVWKEKYAFEPGQAWIEHIMKSAVRFNNGGSGAFVSAGGLVITNHHVGFDCIQKISTGEKDYVKDGYMARDGKDEAPCPDLELNVLVSLEDVTERVTSAAENAESDAGSGKLRKQEMAKIEKECKDATALRCNVTALYGGGQYTLHRYKKYTEVRLVMAPQQQVAFFGGNYDNFTFPRYDLDFSLFRVYENGKPCHSEHYLRWSKEGAAVGELVLVIGNPASTGRQLTVAQLEFLRDVKFPNRLRTFKRVRKVLDQYASTSEEHDRQVKKHLFSYDNALKAYKGLMKGITGGGTCKEKKKEEAAFKEAVGKVPGLYAGVKGSWKKIAEAQEKHAEIHVPKYIADSMVRRSELLRRAVTIVQMVVEKKKPNVERLEDYRESALESVELDLYSDAPIYKELERVMLQNSLEEALEVLGKEHALVKAALDGKEPAELAMELVEGTTLYDPAARRQLVKKGGKLGLNKWNKKIGTSKDTMIRLALRVDPVLRHLEKRYEEEVESVERTEGLKLAKARFKVYGKDIPPDATFTPRIAFGRVKGYGAEGTLVPYKTNFYGLYARSMAFCGKPPFHLPKQWLEKKDSVNMEAALNFCYTADTIGGNSGSPVINRKGELVGLNFDRNFDGLGSRFYRYEEEKARAIAVHSAGILEALVSIFDAPEIAKELEDGETVAAGF